MERFNTVGRSSRARGATVVEMSLLTIAIVVASATGIRALGHGATRAGVAASSALDSDARGHGDVDPTQTVTVGVSGPSLTEEPVATNVRRPSLRGRERTASIGR